MQKNNKSISFDPMQNLRKAARLILPAFFFIVYGCDNKEESSPYSNIYNLSELKDLSDSIRRFPKNDQLYYRRANALIGIGEQYIDAAIYDMQKAWELNKNEQYALDMAGLLQMNNPDSAINFLKSVIPSYPGNLFLKESLGDAYNEAKKYTDALTAYEDLLQTDSLNPFLLQKKASVLEKSGNAEESIAILETIYNAGHKFVGAELAFKLAEHKNAKALKITDDMIREDSAGEHAEPYYFKGVYYYNTGDKNKAIQLFGQAIEHDYNFIDAWIEKGKTQYELKQFTEAQKTFEKATTVSTTYADAYYWLGKCQEALGNKEEARLNYQRSYGFDKTMTEAKEAADKLK
jgi:tetratricopeptide (TPR) repeat protein